MYESYEDYDVEVEVIGFQGTKSLLSMNVLLTLRASRSH